PPSEARQNPPTAFDTEPPCAKIGLADIVRRKAHPHAMASRTCEGDGLAHHGIDRNLGHDGRGAAVPRKRDTSVLGDLHHPRLLVWTVDEEDTLWGALDHGP